MRNPVYDGLMVVADSLVGTALITGLWFAVAPQLGWPRLIRNLKWLRRLHLLGKVELSVVSVLLLPLLAERLTNNDGYGGVMTRSCFNRLFDETSWWLTTATEWASWVNISTPVVGLGAVLGWVCGASLQRRCQRAVERYWGGRCPHCRYSLSGLTRNGTDRCPECGLPMPQSLCPH